MKTFENSFDETLVLQNIWSDAVIWRSSGIPKVIFENLYVKIAKTYKYTPHAKS